MMARRMMGGLTAVLGAAIVLNNELGIFWTSSGATNTTAAITMIVAGWALWNTGKSEA